MNVLGIETSCDETAASVVADGRTILSDVVASQVKDRVGYLPEERGLYRKMTVDQTLRYFGRLKGLHGRALGRRIAECLERVGLQDWHKKRTEALSKGMQQKLQFIIAILHQPELLILDEPFSGLDPLNIELLKELIDELRKRLGPEDLVLVKGSRLAAMDRVADALCSGGNA